MGRNFLRVSFVPKMTLSSDGAVPRRGYDVDRTGGSILMRHLSSVSVGRD